jgi:hypothetical protein
MILLLLLTFVLAVLHFSFWMDKQLHVIQIVIASAMTYFISIWVQIDILWGLVALFTYFLYHFIQKKYWIGLVKSLRWPSIFTLLWCTIMALSTIYYQKHVFPWGGWDAIAIWNLHAKFMADSNHWSEMFSQTLSWSHPDYPLFLPSLIALGWRAIGEINFMVPQILGVIPFLGIISILFFATRNKLLGVIAAFIILFDDQFVDQAASQYADTWLAFYLLMAIYLINQIPERPQLAWVLSIIITSCGWIKNEGLLFFAIASVLVLYLLRNDRRQLIRFLVSGSPIILLLILFKIILTPSNDMIAETNTSLYAKLISIDRYHIILEFIKKSALEDFPILPGLMLVGLFLFNKIPSIMRWNLIILLGLFCVYLAIYLITPKDLSWHLSTSFYRLMHQLYPSVLLCYFLIADNNWEGLKHR